MKTGKSRSTRQKYSPRQTLAQAKNQARYGPLAGTNLAQTAIMVWQAERELAQAEAEFDELLTDIDRLSQVKEAILNSRQFRIVARCTAGIGPQL